MTTSKTVANLWLLLGVMYYCQHLCKAISVEEDLTLTSKEKWALDNFRGAVESYLTKGFMKKDIYLIKWLRARDLNINAAKKLLLDNLKWRKEYGIDGILDEDFSKLETQFPMSTATDYEGRPVMVFDAAEWDVRRAILSGQREDLIRYVFRAIEWSVNEVRELQSNRQPVTQFVVLLNLKGFNIVQHACIQCLPVYINLVLAFENYYPGMVHLVIGINTPSSFDIILNALRPVMSQSTQNALTLFGNNREEWSRFVLNNIPPDQIEEQFGGNKLY